MNSQRSSRIVGIMALLALNIYADSCNYLIPDTLLDVRDRQLELCDKALSTCKDYSKELEGYNKDLKKQEDALIDKLAYEEDRPSKMLWFVIGFVAGGMAYTGINAWSKR